MAKSKKKRLKELGPDILADALLELEKKNDDAVNLIERLLDSPEGAVKKFKMQLAKIKRSRKYYDWREVDGFAEKLEDMLLDLRHNVSDSVVGLELVVSFLKLSGHVFESGDDSNGSLGDVYRYDATDLFTHYAASCTDKELLTSILTDLIRTDEYGGCDDILDDAEEYLDTQELERLAAKFREYADAETDEYARRRWLRAVESLAQHLNDPALFESAHLDAYDTDPGPAACVKIGRAYLKSGDFDTALKWLEKIDSHESFMSQERDELLVKIYKNTGNKEGLEAAAWRIFRRQRTAESLEKLLESIDEDRESVIEKEKEIIFEAPDFSEPDAEFLIACGETGPAEEYVLARESQINGDYYTQVTRLAKMLEANELFHGAIVTYRALLDSILRRGRTKAYYYGARYLKKLDVMAPTIDDWRGIENHKFYLEGLRRVHGRKYSFWSEYGG